MFQKDESERRQCPRKLVDIKVSLSCGDASAPAHTVSVSDISLSGIAIHSENLVLQVGEQLCLCLSPKPEQCSRDHIIEATVVHLRQGMIGVHFDSVGVSILKDIQQLLSGERYF
ncbi:MAG: PilZ domain-containing protein [Pseudomonadota bacterium]